MIINIIKNAVSVVYDNVKSKLAATNVQDAIDEIITIQNGFIIEINKDGWVSSGSEYTYTYSVPGITGNEVLDCDLYDDGTATEDQINAYNSIKEISTSKNQITLTIDEQPTVSFHIAIRGKMDVDNVSYLDAVNKVNELDTKLSTQMSSIKDDIHEQYDNTQTYSIGDYCINDNQLYKCIVDVSTPEDFDQSKWEQTTVGKEIETYKKEINDIKNNFGSKIVLSDTQSGQSYTTGTSSLKNYEILEDGIYSIEFHIEGYDSNLNSRKRCTIYRSNSSVTSEVLCSDESYTNFFALNASCQVECKKGDIIYYSIYTEADIAADTNNKIIYTISKLGGGVYDLLYDDIVNYINKLKEDTLPEIDTDIQTMASDVKDNLSHTVMHSYADYYSADWHNESDVANGRCYLNIATKNDLNLTENTFTTICTGYPKPVLIERIPCVFIVGNSHLIGVAKMTLDGELQLNPPQTISGARCYINASYRIAT